jgi:hypothetical protein
VRRAGRAARIFGVARLRRTDAAKLNKLRHTSAGNQQRLARKNPV